MSEDYFCKDVPLSEKARGVIEDDRRNKERFIT